MSDLIERAKRLQEENIFLGGPLPLFEVAGRKQLMVLLSEGLRPGSKVLDIGCGCLRCGYWLIHFLDRGCYFGIEPNQPMLEAGLNLLLEPNLAAMKQPTFDGNAAFNFSVFGTTFDFLVARSIWSHASKAQIETMLDGFVRYANADAVFMTSYLQPSLKARVLGRDYKGEGWVGRSHVSDAPGAVQHSLGWIRKVCANRGLSAEEIRDKPFNFGNQTWLRIKRKPTA